jgi:uncharacterized protein (TIGR00725 family)
MKNIIGVIGAATSGVDMPNKTALAYAYETGKLIAENGAVLVTGGMSGIMEAASKGASEAGGITLGFLPGMDKSAANPFVDIVLPTGVGLARNVLTVRAADVLIMISGGTGTLNELTTAVNENQTTAIVLEGTGGWADRIREIAYDGKFLDERRRNPLLFASNPQDAVMKALQICLAKLS